MNICLCMRWCCAVFGALSMWLNWTRAYIMCVCVGFNAIHLIFYIENYKTKLYFEFSTWSAYSAKERRKGRKL